MQGTRELGKGNGAFDFRNESTLFNIPKVASTQQAYEQDDNTQEIQKNHAGNEVDMVVDLEVDFDNEDSPYRELKIKS